MGTSIKLHNKTLDKTSAIVSPDNQTEDLEIKLPNKNGTLATTDDLGTAVNEEKVKEIVNNTISTSTTIEKIIEKVVTGTPTENGDGSSTTVNNFYYRGERIIRALREDRVITVGTDGDFGELSEALEECSYYKPVFNPDLTVESWLVAVGRTGIDLKNAEKIGREPRIVIKILKGTTLYKPITLSAVNLSYVTIIADGDVIVDPSAIYKDDGSVKITNNILGHITPDELGGRVFFLLDGGAIGPNIACCFAYKNKPYTMTNGYANNWKAPTFMYLQNNSNITFSTGSEIKNFQKGIVMEFSNVYCGGTKFTNLSVGIYVDNTSRAAAWACTFTNCYLAHYLGQNSFCHFEQSVHNRGEVQDSNKYTGIFRVTGPCIGWGTTAAVNGFKATDSFLCIENYTGGIFFVGRCNGYKDKSPQMPLFQSNWTPALANKSFRNDNGSWINIYQTN